MEASAVPRGAPGASGLGSPHLLRLASDARLVALIREGRSAAFETAYNRHHRGILSFCRHMLGDAEEAEDAVQHTFLSAYNDLISSTKPIQLRAWLFKIARNRCYSMLRARRELPSAQLDEPVCEGVAVQAQHRQDLRDLIVDLRRLPSDQRAALVLAELDALTHEEIGEALGVPQEKVKALVFQARESLIASRVARETDCAEIRRQLTTQRGGGLRRTNLRRHLRECRGCRDFRRQIDRQRKQLAILLPVAPTLALRDGVMAATFGGGAAGLSGGGVVASSAISSGLLKGVVGMILASVGTAGTIVAAHDLHLQGAGGSKAHKLPSQLSPAAGDRTVAAQGAGAVVRIAAQPSLPTASSAVPDGRSGIMPPRTSPMLNPFAPVVVGWGPRPRRSPTPAPAPPSTPPGGSLPAQSSSLGSGVPNGGPWKGGGGGSGGNAAKSRGQGATGGRVARVSSGTGRGERGSSPGYGLRAAGSGRGPDATGPGGRGAGGNPSGHGDGTGTSAPGSPNGAGAGAPAGGSSGTAAGGPAGAAASAGGSSGAAAGAAAAGATGAAAAGPTGAVTGETSGRPSSVV